MNTSLAQIIYNSTLSYLDTVPRSERKKIGQFFTPASIATYMGTMSQCFKDTVCVLDPGAGSGILSAAIVDKLIAENVTCIHLDVYENNAGILSLLKKNLELIQKTAQQSGVQLKYCIYENNFIESNQFAWTGIARNEKYDVVICNPPYKKIGKSDVESRVMSDIVYGQPNLYFLFMAMGISLLKHGGEFIYIVPRSFSSGLYFTAFRNWFTRTMRITNLHLFTSREAVSGAKDCVLQETVILRAEKAADYPDTIEVTESAGEDCRIINRYYVDYHTCVRSGENSFLFFPASEEDINALEFVSRWPASLPMLGCRMKTGMVVDFRETEWMRTDPDDSMIPLLWAYNFSKNRIYFPVSIEGKPQYLLDTKETQRLRMKKGNYLLLKRFTSKEEKKRLQCSLVLEEDFSSYPAISTENHLNFITKVTGSMSREELYGLFVVLNSSCMDRYFRILNGSTQVNANEINAAPFPAYRDIVQMGRKSILSQSLSEETCDAILGEQFDYAVIRKAI